MGEIEIFLAICSLLGAALGLVSAVISRKKVIEIRHVYGAAEQQRWLSDNKKWYDKYLWLFIWTLFFFPVGYYGIYKSRTIHRWMKVVIIGLHILIVIASGAK